ncbi:MAG: iron-containing alcohol dehydrogenase [Bacteroidota bacterium]
MVTSFQTAATPHIIFGPNSLSKLPSIIRGFGPWILVLTGRSSFAKSEHWTRLRDRFKEEGINWSHAIIDQEPSPLMIDQIVNDHRDGVLDAVVAIGGGSVLDAGKAISAMICHKGSVVNYLEGVGSMSPSGEKLPFIAVPTTAGTGSETTKNAVITQFGTSGFKKSLRHDAYVPNIALIDPTLALGTPASITAASGMDAFTQLLEAYLSTKATPITDALALDGLRSIHLGLKKAVNEPDNLEARSHMAYAASLSGICLANAGLGLVHGYASSVGGRIQIPHGHLCATLMSSVNRRTVTKLEKTGDAAGVLHKYAQVGKIFLEGGHHKEEYYSTYLLDEISQMENDFGIKKLANFGLTSDMIQGIVDKTSHKNHPVEMTVEEMGEILVENM